MMKVQVEEQPRDGKHAIYVWWSGTGGPGELIGILKMKEEAIDDFLALIRLGALQMWIGTQMFSDAMYPGKEIEEIFQLDDRRNS